MKKFAVIFFAAAVVLSGSGCLSILPGGKAPEGRITDNSSGTSTLTVAELENNAATSLAAFLLTYPERRTIISCGDAHSEKLLLQISAVTGTTTDKDADLVLEFSAAGNKPFFKLYDRKNRKIIWRYPEQD